MDHASFALKQHLLVLHQAGIRHLLAVPVAPVRAGTVSPTAPATAPADSPVPVRAEANRAAATSVLGQEPWAGFLAKMPQGAQSVWTYEGLGQDLTGQPSAERRKTLGRLLAAVRLPKGFVGFFPYCLPSESATVYHQDVFWDAVTRLRPASVVLFSDSQDDPLARTYSGSEISTALFQVSFLDVFSRMTDDELHVEASALRTSIFPGS